METAGPHVCKDKSAAAFSQDSPDSPTDLVSSTESQYDFGTGLKITAQHNLCDRFMILII